MNNTEKILIFDTNIFLLGINFNIIKETIYTTPKIIEEIKVDRYKEKNRNIMFRVEAAIESKKLLIQYPSEEFLKIVDEKALLTGDYKALSEADKELIALTLELMDNPNNDVVIYTNDYSMENLCSEMEINFLPFLKKGIKAKRIWEVYCPYCKSIHKPEDLNKECEICGMRLKRRPTD